MGGYTNGQWPESMLIVIDEGVDEDGPWKHLVTAGTLHKINHLKELAFRRTGRRLEISPGWSCYRPLGPQRIYRARYGTGASVVGKSSHGINWWDGDRGWITCLAVDFHNWGWVYGWDQDAWFADCRTAGLEPGLIMKWRGNGYPDEPWHVIDLEPFKAPPAPAPKPRQEEDDMLFLNIEGKYLVSVGVGVLKHWGPATSQSVREHVKNISRTDDAWQPVTTEQFQATLAAYGCDRDIWDVRQFGKTKDFCVLNPLDGSVKQGNTWTAVNAMRAEQRKKVAAS